MVRQDLEKMVETLKVKLERSEDHVFLFFWGVRGSRKSMDLEGILGKSVEEGLVGRSVLWVVVCFC